MQTASKVTKESGMLHTEGGWPKEINMKDEEAVQRFRRRVEKDENWAPRMKKLTDVSVSLRDNIHHANSFKILIWF